MIKVFLDTEFANLTDEAALLSLAMVDESGEAFYSVFPLAEDESLSPFVRENVLPVLKELPQVEEGRLTSLCGNRAEIVTALTSWLEERGDVVQVWADVACYDWRQFCLLYGGVPFLPACVHYIPMDLATLLWVRGVDPDSERASLISRGILPKGYVMHNALSDAYLGMLILKKYQSNSNV